MTDVSTNSLRELAGVSGSYELLPEHGDFISFPLVLDYNSTFNDITTAKLISNLQDWLTRIFVTK